MKRPSMRRTLARAVSVWGIWCIAAFVIQPPAALAYSVAGGIARWSDDTYVTNAKGNRGEMYAYPRPTTTEKVCSIYVRDPIYPSYYVVELGYSATGAYPYNGDPANHDPFLFTARMRAGEYLARNYTSTPFPVNQRTSVRIQNTSSWDDWAMFYNDLALTPWYDMLFTHGRPDVSEERWDLQVDGRASITYMKLMQPDLSWAHWWHGVGDDYDDGLTQWYSFRFNHVGDSNHWVYCDDHNN